MKTNGAERTGNLDLSNSTADKMKMSKNNKDFVAERVRFINFK